MKRWFLAVRGLNGLDQDQLAKYLGKGRSTVAAYENGTRAVQPEDIAKILGSFPGTPPFPVGSEEIEIRSSLEGPAPSYQIRFAGVVPCSTEWGDPLMSEDLVPIDYKFTGSKRFAAAVAGHSCYPYLQQGDTAIFESDSAPPEGSIVLAQRKGDHGCTVKELRREGVRHVLIPLNPEVDRPEDGDGWGVVARLVGLIWDCEGADTNTYIASGLRRKHLEQRAAGM